LSVRRQFQLKKSLRLIASVLPLLLEQADKIAAAIKVITLELGFTKESPQ